MKPKKVLFIMIGCAGTLLLMLQPVSQDLFMQGLDKYSLFKNYTDGGQRKAVRH